MDYSSGVKEERRGKSEATLMFYLWLQRGRHTAPIQSQLQNQIYQSKHKIQLFVHSNPYLQSQTDQPPNDLIILLAQQSGYKYMSERNRRLRSVQSDLQEIYQDLFGAKYIPGLQATDKEQFNTIIETFRERVFAIREKQEQRDRREAKKGYQQSTYDIRDNQEIRQDIKTCEEILKEAVRRKKTNLKGKSPEATQKILSNRERTLKNCFQLLQDIQQTEDGGFYKPPEPKQSLEHLKQKLVHQIEDEDRIDLSDEQKFDGYKRKDMEIDEGLDEVIHENRLIQDGLKQANNTIDATGQKIKQNLLRVQRVDAKVRKGTKDLAQVLLHYRKPNKLCLDITMVLLLIALVGVIINMIRYSA